MTGDPQPFGGFPHPGGYTVSTQTPNPTIRQYYKAAALTGMLPTAEAGMNRHGIPDENVLRARLMTEWAGILADAMLAEDREHKGKTP